MRDCNWKRGFECPNICIVTQRVIETSERFAKVEFLAVIHIIHRNDSAKNTVPVECPLTAKSKHSQDHTHTL